MRLLLRVNAMLTFIASTWCAYYILWLCSELATKLCELIVCWQTHIKNRLFVRQYRVQCIICWFLATYKSVFYGISNLISKFHVCPFVCLHRQFVFFVCCFLAHAEIILWSVCPIVHSMVSWHKFIYLVCIQRKKHTKLYGHIFILRVYWFFYRFVVSRWYFSHLNTMHIIQLEIRHMRFWSHPLHTAHCHHITYSTLSCVCLCVYIIGLQCTQLIGLICIDIHNRLGC